MSVSNAYTNGCANGAFESRLPAKKQIRTISEKPGIPIPQKGHAGQHRHGVSSPPGGDGFTARSIPSNPISASPMTVFSHHHGAGSVPVQSSVPVNIYSMSPRSTSFMFQYYSTPRSFFQANSAKVTRPGKLCVRSQSHEAEESAVVNRSRLTRTISECCQKSPSLVAHSPVISALPRTLQSDVVEDPRRRTFSESDKQSGKASGGALRKLRRKLTRTASLKRSSKNFDEHADSHDSTRTSTSSINSLEKVEEGVHRSPGLGESFNSTGSVFDAFPGLSLHEEDETYRSPTQADMTSNPEADLVYQRFLEEHTCYDIMPTSCKIVVFDTKLPARKAFHALMANGERSAPLWDSASHSYVGALTVTDFIDVIIAYERSPDATTSKQCLEEQTIETWRRALNRTQRFTAVTPHDSVFESLRLLHDEHLHGIPVADPKSGDIYHVITHKRILRFLHLFINELPIPAFLYKTLAETRIGTYGAAVAMVTRNDTLLKVLEVIVDRRVTALPVVDERGRVVDVFCKLDMISLAAQEMYHDLSMTLEVALELRFNPIFEIEQPHQLSTADAFTRFSSPKPRRRDFARQNSEGKHRHHRRSHHWSGNDGATDDVMSRCPPGARAGHVTPPSHERRERPTSHPPSSNHQSHLPTSPLVARTTLPRSNSKQPPSSRASSSPASSVTSDTAGRGPYRHRSVSRHQPLVKCHLSDTLHGIIDMLISTDINMLVVVGEDDDDVIGIVTVADVLNYIVDPYSKHLIPRKLEKEEDAPQSASSSASDVTSGDSGCVTSSHRSSTSSGGFRLSTTSDAPNNDSGYTSSVTSSVGFASSTVAVDFRGAQIERS